MKQKIIVGALIIVGLASITYAAFSQALITEKTDVAGLSGDAKAAFISNEY